MWELDCEESWAMKNWCFCTVVLEKTLESPLDCKEISPACSLKGLMLKLKLQYFGHLMRRADSFEKTLMLGKIRAGGEGDKRGWDGWMASPTQWTWVWVDSGSWWWTGRPGVLRFMRSQRVGHDWATELNWTDPGPRYPSALLVRVCVGGIGLGWVQWSKVGAKLFNGTFTRWTLQWKEYIKPRHCIYC